MDKVSLRNLIKVELRKIPHDDFQAINVNFNHHTQLAYQYFSNNYNLTRPTDGVYAPQIIEPQIDWGKMNVDLAYPQIENGELKYRSWKQDGLPKDWKELWDTEAIEPSMIFVPALSMSQTGFRLGQGGGYFDQYLASRSIKIKIGICFKKYFDYQWKPEKHDVAFDYVLTEEFLWSVKTAGFVEMNKEN